MVTLYAAVITNWGTLLIVTANYLLCHITEQLSSNRHSLAPPGDTPTSSPASSSPASFTLLNAPHLKFRARLRWCDDGAMMVWWWCYDGVMMVLWLRHDGVMMVLWRCHDGVMKVSWWCWWLVKCHLRWVANISSPGRNSRHLSTTDQTFRPVCRWRCASSPR